MAKKTVAKSKVASKAKVVAKKKPIVKAKSQVKAKAKPAPKAKVKPQPKAKASAKVVKKAIVKKPVAKKVVAKAKPVAKVIAPKIVPKKEAPKPVVKVVAAAAPKKTGGKEKTNYSDKELQEFKTLIMEKLEDARKDLELLTEAFTNTGVNNTDDTSPTFKLMEEGHQVLSKEENSQLAARQQKFIQNLEAALVRIENKSYGICRVTGKLIPRERLRIVPHATLSMEAKMQQKNPRNFMSSNPSLMD